MTGSLTDAMTTKDNIEDSARGKFDVEKATSAKGSARGSAQFLAEVESGRAIKVPFTLTVANPDQHLYKRGSNDR
jgi:hypothetical protein